MHRENFQGGALLISIEVAHLGRETGSSGLCNLRLIQHVGGLLSWLTSRRLPAQIT